MCNTNHTCYLCPHHHFHTIWIMQQSKDVRCLYVRQMSMTTKYTLAAQRVCAMQTIICSLYIYSALLDRQVVFSRSLGNHFFVQKHQEVRGLRRNGNHIIIFTRLYTILRPLSSFSDLWIIHESMPRARNQRGSWAILGAANYCVRDVNFWYRIESYIVLKKTWANL